MFKKILVTGGPVHVYLDDVKIITNKFKGGLMAQTSDDLEVVFNTVHQGSPHSDLHKGCRKAQML